MNAALANVPRRGDGRVKPAVTRGPIATTFVCPLCGHKEVGLRRVPYAATRADGRIRTHIAECSKVAA
jgi:transcription elongation factor Elf1